VPLALVAAWEIGAAYADQPWIFPRFTSVMRRLAEPFADFYAQGSLAGNTLTSILRVSVGVVLAALAGIGLGLVLGAVRTLRGLFEPILEILRPLSPIAWLPFAIAVFKLRTLGDVVGLSHTGTLLDRVQLGMVFVIFWGGFFPVFVNTMDGVMGVRRSYLLLARTLGASRRQMFLKVYLPAALPAVITGLRLGASSSWRVIIAAEMLPGSQSGIGYMLIYAADQAAMDVVVAAMIIIGVIGALVNLFMRLAMGAFVRWRTEET